ncbi:MAG: flagellar biosynthetic protein FliQ [Phycisphaerae bacterium]|jgi:flagellar biosynthetic protein FliQ
MLDDMTIDMVRTALVMSIKIGAPILAAGIVVGLVISLLQSITSIQDQTLATVPKIIVMVVAAIAVLPWVVQRLIEYAGDLLRIV